MTVRADAQQAPDNWMFDATKAIVPRRFSQVMIAPRGRNSAVTANVDQLIEQKISQGRKLGPDELASRPRWTQLRDAATRLLLPYL